MAILTQFPSTEWNITLNVPVTALTQSNVPAIGGTNTVTAVSGSGTTWKLTLTDAVETLAPSAVMITGITTTPPVEVVSTDNAAIAPFMQEIRNLLRIGLDAQDLPDATIRQLSYLRQAEMNVYQEAPIKTDTAYDSAASNPLLRDRYRIATMYHTAALLVPALPDIVREEFKEEYRQYVQMQGEDKINLFLGAAKDALIPEQPTTASVSNVGELGRSYTRYTAF